MRQDHLPDRLKARCPVDGCNNVVRIHKSSDPDVVMFTCDKHGDRMTITKTAGNADKIAKLLPELPVSPYPKLIAVEFLDHFMTFPRRTIPYKMYFYETHRIAKQFVKQFCYEMLTTSLEKLRKQKVMKAWRTWFKDHYYRDHVSNYLLMDTMRELGYVDDFTGKYILCTCFKGE